MPTSDLNTFVIRGAVRFVLGESVGCMQRSFRMLKQLVFPMAVFDAAQLKNWTR
jgi:hypothetical protein